MRDAVDTPDVLVTVLKAEILKQLDASHSVDPA
jgi:hypothetical protein